jgi:hypothetical protein
VVCGIIVISELSVSSPVLTTFLFLVYLLFFPLPSFIYLQTLNKKTSCFLASFFARLHP